MLYEIEVMELRPKDDDSIARYETYVVEAPSSTRVNGQDVLPQPLHEFASQRAHEASVQWGFVEVELTVSHFFPARVGWPKDNGSCTRFILVERKYQCIKEHTS